MRSVLIIYIILFSLFMELQDSTCNFVRISAPEQFHVFKAKEKQSFKNINSCVKQIESQCPFSSDGSDDSGLSKDVSVYYALPVNLKLIEFQVSMSVEYIKSEHELFDLYNPEINLPPII